MIKTSLNFDEQRIVVDQERGEMFLFVSKNQQCFDYLDVLIMARVSTDASMLLNNRKENFSTMQHSLDELIPS